MEVGETVRMKGYITQFHFLAGKGASRLESLLGYKAGRLAGGWALLDLCKLPGPADFEFRGYSYLSGGIIEGHKDENKGGKTAEIRLKDGNFDVAALKESLIKKTFCISGAKRLVKIVPKDPPSGNKDYPPGSGVPQWELMKKLPFKVSAVMLPDGKKWDKKG
jgi:hypothetical protein